MPYGGKFQVSSSNTRNLLLKHRSAFKTTFQNAHFYHFYHFYHGMENWLVLETFYHELSTNTREMMDAAAGGALLSLTLT
jgi:hypothetical protein